MPTGPRLITAIDRTRVPPGACAFWWLGQHGFVVKLGKTVVYIDAYLQPNKSRTVKPLLAPEEITNADLILGSHDHADHIDRWAWPCMAATSPKAQFIVPALLVKKVSACLHIPTDRIQGVDEGITVRCKGVSITAVPAAHEFLDTDDRTGLHPYVGFIIKGNGVTIYHAGDSCIYEGQRAAVARFKPDIAFLPINGRDAKRLAVNCIGNMTYQEAADLAGALKPRLTVPAHFEMFAMNSADPQLFVDYMRVKYPRLKTVIPRHGTKVMVSSDN